eukprot:4960821-Prymnesium_polylepis.2
MRTGSQRRPTYRATHAFSSSSTNVETNSSRNGVAAISPTAWPRTLPTSLPTSPPPASMSSMAARTSTSAAPAPSYIRAACTMWSS